MTAIATPRTASASTRPTGFRRRPNLIPTIILLVGALYCLVPVLWILIASTKSNGELFSTPPLVPSFDGSFWSNMTGILSYNHGIWVRWALNTILYAGGGGALSTLIAASAGYALGKYTFRGSKFVFRTIVAAVLLPPVLLAVPQYLLLAPIGLTNTYWSVLLPQLVSPFAIYLCKIYAEASVPDELMEAARIDGASEWRIFHSIGLRLMGPALITVFLIQFIAVWNNFLLPFVMLTDNDLYPLTLGMYGMIMPTGGQPNQFSLVIAGVFLSIIPLAAIFLSLQRFWKIDLISGGVKL